MTPTTKPPFQPVDRDPDDLALERLAAAKGVAAMVKPSAPIAEIPVRTVPVALPKGRRKTVNLELPDYLWTDLKIAAARTETTVRHVIMTALRAQGYMIADADMVEDGRRLRGVTAEAAS